MRPMLRSIMTDLKKDRKTERQERKKEQKRKKRKKERAIRAIKSLEWLYLLSKFLGSDFPMLISQRQNK